ncbi:hypothetical protein HHX47_DHR9000302 [Lentinula edodes]|nr:hypothetical protein HHX47_DHR9000302 [Lentinula edodes]
MVLYTGTTQFHKSNFPFTVSVTCGKLYSHPSTPADSISVLLLQFCLSICWNFLRHSRYLEHSDTPAICGLYLPPPKDDSILSGLHMTGDFRNPPITRGKTSS